jgi:hypothetical protein
MIQVTIDGQVFNLSEDIGGKDELLRAALAPFVPWIVNAQIERKEQDGNTLVSVIKRADTKGAAAHVVDALVDAPQQMNPAIELWRRLQQDVALDDPGAMVEWQPTIAQAIEVGEHDIETIHATLLYLANCDSIPASHLPLGF